MTRPDNRGVSDEDLALFGNSSQPPARVEQDKPEVSKPASQKGKVPGTRVMKYPWEEWMDGKEHIVVRGDHFTTPITVFQTMLHNTASRYDMAVATAKLPEDSVMFQFCKDGAEAWNIKAAWKADATEANE